MNILIPQFNCVNFLNFGNLFQTTNKNLECTTLFSGGKTKYNQSSSPYPNYAHENLQLDLKIWDALFILFIIILLLFLSWVFWWPGILRLESFSKCLYPTSLPHTKLQDVNLGGRNCLSSTFYQSKIKHNFGSHAKGDSQKFKIEEDEELWSSDQKS